MDGEAFFPSTYIFLLYKELPVSPYSLPSGFLLGLSHRSRRGRRHRLSDHQRNPHKYCNQSFGPSVYRQGLSVYFSDCGLLEDCQTSDSSAVSLPCRPPIWLPQTWTVNPTRICWSALDSRFWTPKTDTSRSSSTLRLESQCFFLPILI